MSLLAPPRSPCLALYWPQGVETRPRCGRRGSSGSACRPGRAEAWRGGGLLGDPDERRRTWPRARSCPPRESRRGPIAPPRRAARGSSPTAGASCASRAGRYAYDLPAGQGRAGGRRGVRLRRRRGPEDRSCGPRGARRRCWPSSRQLPASDAARRSPTSAVVDDGSPSIGEVMNLLVRRNLLFRVVARAGCRSSASTSSWGRSEYPRKEAADPSAFALKIRRRAHRRATVAAHLRQRGRDRPAHRRRGPRSACTCSTTAAARSRASASACAAPTPTGEAFVAGQGRVPLSGPRDRGRGHGVLARPRWEPTPWSTCRASGVTEHGTASSPC